MRHVLASVACSAVLALTGCGGSGGIGETASAALSPRVHAVRVAAEAGDRDRALAELAALRQHIGQLRAADALSARGARNVLEAALDVERQLMLLSAPGRDDEDDDDRPTATTRTAPTPDERVKAADEARKQAEEAAKKAEEEARKAAEEAKKRAEEAVKKAEEEAKKLAEQGKKE